MCNTFLPYTHTYFKNFGLFERLKYFLTKVGKVLEICFI